MEFAVEFATFCNICFKHEGLRKIEENEHLFNILIIIIENKTVINRHEIYLCLKCCENLESYDRFKEMCLRNLIHFRGEYCKLKKKLETYYDPNVEMKLRNFIESKMHGAGDPLKLDEVEDTIKAERDIISIQESEKNLIRKKDKTNDYKYDFHGVSCKTENIEYEDKEDYKLHTESDLEDNDDNSELPVPIEHIKVEAYVEGDVDASESSSKNERRESSEITLSRKENECSVCKKTFVSISNFKTHMRIHTGEKPFTCTICNKSFAQSNTLKAHQLTHTGEKPYSCNICSKAYSQLGSLKEHERVHTGEKPHICNICNKAFTLSTRLKTHMLIHTGEKPHTCSICNKNFRRSENLKRHERVHTGEKPYACSMCDKTFSLSGNLKMHERVHTGEKPYSCRACEKSYSHISHLKAHERLHTGEKPYECAVCSKRFTRITSFTVHKLTHTGEKPYTCNVCKKTFTQSSTLRKHERIHTGDKPYSCDICKKTFRQSSNYKLHKQKPCVQVMQDRITRGNT